MRRAKLAAVGIEEVSCRRIAAFGLLFNGKGQAVRSPSSLAFSLFVSALVVVGCMSLTSAATLTWTGGNGNWDLVSGNTVWNDGSSNVPWSNGSLTAAINAAVFAQADGPATVTIPNQVNAQSVTFNSDNYTVAGGPSVTGGLILRPTSTTNGGITVAASKTATITAPITYSNNAAASNTIDTGATLNLGGGATNAQYTFNGTGTVNILGGSYEANIGNVNLPVMNITGGTLNYTPGNNTGPNFGNAVARNVNVTVATAGTLTLNNATTNSAATAPGIGIGNNTNNTSFTASLTVQSGGTVIVANQGNRQGEILVSKTSNANGLLDVQGGSVNVGVGSSSVSNQIYLFKNGAASGYSSRFTQSGGEVLANGIQFGGASGTYDGAAIASIELSGGTLSIGGAGITEGSGASDLGRTITLTGGTVGAEAPWSSSLAMQLGTAGGGVTFSTESTGAVVNSINLSGILSDASSSNGTLTKAGGGTLSLSGANTYSGNTTISTGTLALGASGSIANSPVISVGSGATFDVSSVAGFATGASQELAGSGTVTGAVTANGTISPGVASVASGIGTISFANDLGLAGGSILDFQLDGSDTTAGGGVNDLISLVSGSLTLDGVINVTALNSFASATVGNTWRLMDYSGTLTDNGLTLGSMPALASGLAFSLDTATANQVNLVVTAVPEPATLVSGMIGLGGLGLAAARRRRSRSRC